VTSIEQARYKRDVLAEADNHYWASLTIAEEAQPSSPVKRPKTPAAATAWLP